MIPLLVLWGCHRECQVPPKKMPHVLLPRLVLVLLVTLWQLSSLLML